MRIKSPQLYQLSYRPKYKRLLAKLVIRVLGRGRIVPPVYPNTASGAIEVGFRAVTT